ncbi:hypothetical protein KJ853_03850 [Patescibacteria group bacterium]|nr:hypothetical protein [Patescibacteria group bacterium]
MLSKEALEEFKKIWKEEKNEEISDDFAMNEAVNLLTLFNAIYRPIKKEWLKNQNVNRTIKKNK